MDVCTENDESGLMAAEQIKITMPQIKSNYRDFFSRVQFY